MLFLDKKYNAAVLLFMARRKRVLLVLWLEMAAILKGHDKHLRDLFGNGGDLGALQGIAIGNRRDRGVVTRQPEHISTDNSILLLIQCHQLLWHVTQS